jgi:hypothetical protein
MDVSPFHVLRFHLLRLGKRDQSPSRTRGPIPVLGSDAWLGRFGSYRFGDDSLVGWYLRR